MTRRLLIAVLLACAGRAHALGEGAVTAEAAIIHGIGATQHAVVRGSAENVFSRGHGLQALINGYTPVYAAQMHEVQRAKVDGDASTIDKVLSNSDDELAAAGAKFGAADLRGAQRLQRQLRADSRLDFEQGLGDSEMGVFRFTPGRGAEGKIGINPILAQLGQLIGHAFVAATMFHESGHAADAAIDQTGVIEGEIPAFQLEYQWLVLVDPTGEKLALLRVALAEHHAASPSRLTQVALDYARTLDVLRGTGGDPDRIRKFIGTLGYQEGVGKSDPGALPNS